MKKIIIVSFLTLLGYLFIGIEIIYSEDGAGYDPFLKKYPTTQFKFNNPTFHRESDFRDYLKLTVAGQNKFRDLCYYRYGLEDISQCEDLFRPKN